MPKCLGATDTPLAKPRVLRYSLSGALRGILFPSFFIEPYFLLIVSKSLPQGLRGPAVARHSLATRAALHQRNDLIAYKHP